MEGAAGETMEQILDFMRAGRHCVLATRGEDGAPWTSLMAYAADERSGVFVLATLEGTRKAANLRAEPRVSLLIDDRDARQGASPGELHALTVAGRAEIVEDPAGREALAAMLLARHPDMAPFLARPEARMVRVLAGECQLLSGLTSALRFCYHERTAP